MFLSEGKFLCKDCTSIKKWSKKRKKWSKTQIWPPVLAKLKNDKIQQKSLALNLKFQIQSPEFYLNSQQQELKENYTFNFTVFENDTRI